MPASYTYSVARDCPTGIYEEILNIRKEHFYDDAFASNYWNGGIQAVLDEKILITSHQEDSNSRFLFLYDSNETLVAYSRFSVNEKIVRGFNISKLHIFAVSKNLLGKSIYIDGMLQKAGNFMLSEVIKYCSSYRSEILISEISVYPYPNLPSLILHKKMDFISIANSLKFSKREDGVSNSFIVLGRYLTNKKPILFSLNEI